MGFKESEDRPYMWESQKTLNEMASTAAKAFDVFYKVSRSRFPNEELA